VVRSGIPLPGKMKTERSPLDLAKQRAQVALAMVRMEANLE